MMRFMEIRTNAQIDPLMQSVWAVFAEWFGEERIVFTGSLFECCQFKANS